MLLLCRREACEDDIKLIDYLIQQQKAVDTEMISNFQDVAGNAESLQKRNRELTAVKDQQQTVVADVDSFLIRVYMKMEPFILHGT